MPGGNEQIPLPPEPTQKGGTAWWGPGADGPPMIPDFYTAEVGVVGRYSVTACKHYPNQPLEL